jgi:hypothetical protein
MCFEHCGLGSHQQCRSQCHDPLHAAHINNQEMMKYLGCDYLDAAERCELRGVYLVTEPVVGDVYFILLQEFDNLGAGNNSQLLALGEIFEFAKAVLDKVDSCCTVH